MCGFAGRVNLGRPVDRAELEAMNALLAHRGPDGQGVYEDDLAGLSHRRLAIVDLAGGAQPLAGRAVLAYNGEVMNHAALRAELAARGQTFETRCDTEVVLRAHEIWGPTGAPPRLRGMFAYAAWDRAARTLTLVRDRLGIKPLYYSHLPSGELVFASELKALLACSEVDRTIDEDALACYLALRWVPAPATLLRGVRKLEPGSALIWRDGAIRLSHWADDARAHDAPPPPPTFVEGAGRLTQLLDEAIGSWRMSDVPLGAFLSGGLDSTLVAAILVRLARAAGDPVPCTFSVGYLGADVAAHDELPWARLAARALGTRHREIAITGEQVAEALPQIAWALDEPLGDPASIPLWFVARRARAEVTVALSGEGADEVFGGYAIYRRLAQADRVRERIPAAAALADLLRRALPRRARRLRRACARIATPIEMRYRGVSRAFESTLPFPVADESDGAALDRALAPAWARAISKGSSLARLLAFDRQGWLSDDLLLKADRMTMAHGLELRPPFLDHRLVDEVAAWPDDWKIDPVTGVQKRILRLAAEGLVPREVLDRPKIGFGTPSGPWLRGALRPLLSDLVCGPGSLAAERGARATVEKLVHQHERGRDRSAELWALLALELWRREVVAGVTCRTAGSSLELAS